MPPTNEQLAEARKLAVLSSRYGKRGPSQKTLIKREARERATEGLKEHYLATGIRELPEIIKIQYQQAKIPKNRQEREYVLDRNLGKSPLQEGFPNQVHFHQHIHQDLSDEQRRLIEEYEAKLREIKTR